MFRANPFVLCSKQHSFIHSWYFYSAFSSTLLLRGAPDYGIHSVSELTRQSTTALPVKDLPKVPTWQLEWDSNMWPSGRKALNLSLSYHAPQELFMENGALCIVYFTCCLCFCWSWNKFLLNVCITLYLVASWCSVARYINNLKRTQKGEQGINFYYGDR